MIDAIGMANGGPGSSQALGGQELDRDAFLQLLVHQMQNQDPMEPTTNEDFIAQLAQFSSLEQMELVNENLVGLAVLQQSNALIAQLSEGSALIGKEVSFQDPETGETGTGIVESVRVIDGQGVLSVDGRDIALGNVTEVSLPDEEA